MGPRPVRLNRRPPIRYSDGTLGSRCKTVDGGNKEESDSEESNESDSNTFQTSVGARGGDFGGSEGSRAGNRSPIQQTSSPPSSPFHGFVGHCAPVGPDVLGGGFVHCAFSSEFGKYEVTSSQARVDHKPTEA